jgi:hypothetical protein
MWGCVHVRVPWVEQERVQRNVTANPKRYRKPHTPSVTALPRTLYNPRILANTRGEYPVSDSPRRVNTRFSDFPGESHPCGGAQRAACHSEGGRHSSAMHGEPPHTHIPTDAPRGWSQ